MTEAPFSQFVEELAAKTPTPGGGGAAAQTAAMGAALCSMVVRYSRGKKANLDRDLDLETAENALEPLRASLLTMASRDAEAFGAVSAAYGLPKDDPQQVEARNAAIQAAMVGALAVPQELLELIRDALRTVAPVTNCVARNIVSDLGAASALLQAGARSAELLVRINIAWLEDEALGREARVRADQLMADVQACSAQLDARVKELIG